MAVLNRKPTAPRRRLRLPDYDYASPGAYFVSICTHQRVCLFGQITDGTLSANPFGKIVEACWPDLPSHYPNAVLDAFVVMPNHVHGILLIERVFQAAHGLGEIIRGFKTFSARRINELRSTTGKPLWQRGYHEHIVRNEAALEEIRDYINTNPLRWAVDRNNPGYVPAIRAGLKPAPTVGMGR